MWWQTNNNINLQSLLANANVTQRDLLLSLVEIADEAAELSRQFYSKVDELDVIKKNDSTPLTEADTALHDLICRRLGPLFEGVPILSEESVPADIAARHSWRSFWVVDPLDGTKEFIEKTDQFTVNIALVIEGRAELGLIAVPCRREHWLGVVGNGAAVFEEGQALAGKIVTTQALNNDRAVVMLASHRHSPKRVESLMSRLSDRFGAVERLNSGSAVKFCDVVAGIGDVYPRTSPCSEWDVAAGDALVRAAGGTVTDSNGNQILYNRRESLLAEPFVAAADLSIDFAAIIFSER